MKFKSLFNLMFLASLSLTGNWLHAQFQQVGDHMVLPNGYLGLNISNPVRPLHVASVGGESIRLQDTNFSTNQAKATMSFYKADHKLMGFIGVGSGSNNYMQIFAGVDAGVGLYTNGNNLRFTVHKYGNIGIGTGSPDRPLHIFNGTGELLKLQDADGSGLQANPTIGFYDNTNVRLGEFGFTHTTEDFRLITKNGTGIRFGDFANSEKMYLSPDGKLGIGTIDIPNDFQLAVNGKLICEEIKVQLASNWPDYVFSPDYELTPLCEVEASIQSNGHLPGIPSAAEIQENGGIEVGEMQRLMMEKIEEMTLYLIELEKENQQLQDRISRLEHGTQASK